MTLNDSSRTLLLSRLQSEAAPALVNTIAVCMRLARIDWTSDLYRAMIAVCQRAEPPVRILASRAIREVGLVYPECVESLLAALQEAPVEAQITLLAVLASYPLTTSQLEPITHFVNAPAPLVRIAAARILWLRQGDSDAIHPVVHSCLTSVDEQAVCGACQLIADMGKTTTDIAQILAGLATHPSETVRCHVLHALYRLNGNSPQVRELAEQLRTAESPAARFVAGRLARSA